MTLTILSKALIILYFIFLFCRCSDPQIEWEKTKELHTTEAYESFIQQYPKSFYINQASEYIIEIEFERVKSINTIASYENFLQQYPTGRYADSANHLLLALYLPIDFETAKSKNTIDGYIQFIDRHPYSPETKIISALLEEVFYTTATSQNTNSLYEDYLSHFPEGYRSQEILKLLEPYLFKLALNKNIMSSYLHYLKYFPADYRSTSIRKRIELLKQIKYPEQKVNSLLWEAESLVSEGFRFDHFILKMFDQWDIISLSILDEPYDFSEDIAYGLLQAKASEESLLSKINDKGYKSADVVYYIKAHQILLTHLSNYIITINHYNRMLSIWKDAIESRQQGNNRYEKEQLNAEIVLYNKSLDHFNKEIVNFNVYLDLFYEKMQSFSAFLPLEELSKYSYSKKTKSAEVKIQSTAFIYPLEEALSLIISSKMEMGLILLEAIGQIKIAYLAVLLVSQENDYRALEKFDILQEDLEDYYEFVKKKINEFDIAPSINGELESTLYLYRFSEGIFDYSIRKNVEEYYNTQAIEDIMILFKRF